MISDIDVLSQLLEASWRGIPFPNLSVDTSGGHNIVPHLRVDRNGARIENTGRKSLVFSLAIPFINTIAKGPNETWKDLYPITYRKMLTACEDRSTGDFIHPDYGLRKCKVGDYKTSLNPDYRGGTILTLQLMETVDDGDAVALEDTAVIPIATVAARNLDAKLGNLSPSPFKNILGDGVGLTDFIKSLGAIGDQVALFGKKITGKINGVIGALDSLKSSFGGDAGFSADTDRLISSLHAYKIKVLRTEKATSIFVVKKPKGTTVSALANLKKNSVKDILNLNPSLAGKAIVPFNTPIVYYS